MEKKFCITLVMVFGLLFSSNLWAGEKVHWGYDGNTAPEYWGTLSPQFSICSQGKNQSPINLTGMIESHLEPLAVDYKSGGQEVVNNGHSIQVNYAPGSTMTIEGHAFELKQFHFHSPSENTIDDESFPMEAHFVHADKEGNLAVLALMIKVGNNNKELGKVWDKIPLEAHGKNVLTADVDAATLLPKNLDYYRFNGSLTTPPCSEGVRWIVLKNTVTVSKEQLDRFVNVMGHPNNRPVQPVNARVILK